MSRYIRSKLLATAFPSAPDANNLLPRLLFAVMAVLILS